MTTQLADRRRKVKENVAGNDSRGSGAFIGGHENENRQFTTVSIPDLRDLDLSSGQSGSTAAPKSKRRPKISNSSTVASLESIKTAIEKTNLNRTGYTQATGQTTPVVAKPGAKIEPGGNPDLPKQCLLAKLDANDPQIAPIVDSIIDRFPSTGTTVVAFSGSEENPQLNTTISGTALSLQAKRDCRILVIDSDPEDRTLTMQMNCFDHQGFTELVNGHGECSQALSKTYQPKIDFLPVGREGISDLKNMNNVLRKTLTDLSGVYDYVLVNVGDAHGAIAEIWAGHVHGTFLLVSLENTNRSVAKSAVSQLNSFGARLIGCIVSDCEE